MTESDKWKDECARLRADCAILRHMLHAVQGADDEHRCFDACPEADWLRQGIKATLAVTAPKEGES